MIRLFRRPAARPPLTEAELARRLTDPDYACACCGTVLGAAAGAVRPAAPFGWKNVPEALPDDRFDEVRGDVMTESFARWGRANLLRAHLPLPVDGTGAQVLLGVWCSLKVGHHALFRAAQTRGDADKLAEMPSLLYTQLPPMDGPLLTEGVIVPAPDGRAPLYRITNARHPLHEAQRTGLSAGAVLALYEACGCGDLVAHLKA